MTNKLFLLADDDIDDREMFCEALEGIDKNIICHTANDGSEALSTLKELPTPPELIFLDVNMPVMNGWQCLEQIREDERLSGVPVIIISTSSNQREIEIAQSLQAVCYFTKPHNFKDLIKVLSVIVANPGTQLAPALHALEQSGSKHVRAFS